jgi:hypothetical protein
VTWPTLLKGLDRERQKCKMEKIYAPKAHFKRLAVKRVEIGQELGVAKLLKLLVDTLFRLQNDNLRFLKSLLHETALSVN